MANPTRWLGGALAAIIVAAALSACVGGPNDRCYLDDQRYREARRAYERTGSLALVRDALRDAHWPDCQAHEAIYRIEKEFGLKDELPPPPFVRIRSEKELKAEEEADQQQRKSTMDFKNQGVFR